MQKPMLIAALAATLSLPLALNAADEPKKKGGGFTAADADKDGKVTQTEYVAAMKSRLDEAAAKSRFAELDKDKDGSLSREEFNSGAGKKGGKDGEKGGDKGEKKKSAN